MKKAAAIDIGTNSMRLLLATILDGQIVYRHKEINTTRIGKAVDENRHISEEGIRINIEAFSAFVKQARDWGAEEIAAIATSAVRDAANGEAFASLALEKTGVEIKIITGEEEAILGYKGVLMGASTTNSKLMVIDIGGGSTELIIGDDREILKAISLNMGAVRMTERVITTDPVNPEEEEELYKEIKAILNKEIVNLKEHKAEMLIGIGGTATTIAAIHQELEPYDPDRVHKYSLSIEEIKGLLISLKSLSLEERRLLKGLHPKRADIIVAGIAIMVTVMEELGFKELGISEYDNLEGMLI